MLKLWLPVICPSWRFFNAIGPSPRIEYAFDTAASQWQLFRPRPASLPLRQRLVRFIYNPEWNEYLYINGCAERVLNGEAPIERWALEIAQRLHRAMTLGEIHPPQDASRFCFRIGYWQRDHGQLHFQIGYHSTPTLLTQVPRA